MIELLDNDIPATPPPFEVHSATEAKAGQTVTVSVEGAFLMWRRNSTLAMSRYRRRRQVCNKQVFVRAVRKLGVTPRIARIAELPGASTMRPAKKSHFVED